MTAIVIELPEEVAEEIVERVAGIVIERIRMETTTETESPYMTIVEAAAYLRCSRQRVDDLLSQRRLSRAKEGRRTLVARAEIEALLRVQQRRR